jgi:acetyl esterase/lipase
MRARGAADIACMATRMSRMAIVLLALLATAASHASQANALSLADLLNPPPPPPPAIAPVAEKLTRDPADGVVRGTAILVHAGGWAGHDANAQRLLFEHPGDVFTQRGWRVVSLDYDEGTAGLQDVLSAVGEELARGTSPGPICIYGESAGAQLALVAAARVRSIDCVIGLGTPTDLALYEADAATSTNAQVRLVATRMSSFFGATPEALAPWDPLALATSIRGDVLLIGEADDVYVAAAHAQRFAAARPTTQTVVLDPGDPADPSTAFVHGTVSAAGRAQYDAAIGAFADRLVAASQADRDAAALGCPRVTRTLTETSLASMQSAVECLARRDAEARVPFDRQWRRTNVRLRGEIDAARIWARLRTSTAGRRALAAAAKDRATLAIGLSDRSRITLRLSR